MAIDMKQLIIIDMKKLIIILGSISILSGNNIIDKDYAAPNFPKTEEIKFTILNNDLPASWPQSNLILCDSVMFVNAECIETNFRHPACEKQIKNGVCTDKRCLSPKPCKNLVVDHSEYVELLKSIEKVDKVKKVFIRSGIRYDYVMYDKDEAFFKKLVKDHVSGQLRVAPEHNSDNVLKLMGKPEISIYNSFCKKFGELSGQCGKEQYVVPYLMSSHPGSTMEDAVNLSEYIKKEHLPSEQVQDFYPTPSTASTCMYYTGINPFTKEKVYTATDYKEKQKQRALLQPKNSKTLLNANKRNYKKKR